MKEPISRTKSYAIWRKTNGQKYLEVNAPDHYRSGFLQGQYLSKNIHELKDIIKILVLKYKSKRFTYQKSPHEILQ